LKHRQVVGPDVGKHVVRLALRNKDARAQHLRFVSDTDAEGLEPEPSTYGDRNEPTRDGESRRESTEPTGRPHVTISVPQTHKSVRDIQDVDPEAGDSRGPLQADRRWLLTLVVA
jgi:hypothetical protein